MRLKPATKVSRVDRIDVGWLWRSDEQAPAGAGLTWPGPTNRVLPRCEVGGNGFTAKDWSRVGRPDTIDTCRVVHWRHRTVQGNAK